MKFESVITELNRAYNSLKRQGQEFTDTSKVDQLAKQIKNPQNNLQITVTVEHMRTLHKNDYMAATQYMTTQMAQINSTNINSPGLNARQVSEADISCNNFNGIDITDEWRLFTSDKWNKLGDCGRDIVHAKRKNNKHGRPNNSWHNGGRGHGHGRGHGYYGRGGRGGHGGCANNANQPNSNEQNVNKSSTGGRNPPAEVVTNGNSNSSVASGSTNNQASPNERGRQNGVRFGTNRYMT